MLTVLGYKKENDENTTLSLELRLCFTRVGVIGNLSLLFHEESIIRVPFLKKCTLYITIGS